MEADDDSDDEASTDEESAYVPPWTWVLMKKTEIPAEYERGYLIEGSGTTNETCLGCFSSQRIALESAKIAHDDYREHFGPFELASNNKDGTYVLKRLDGDQENLETLWSAPFLSLFCTQIPM
jgi:hypothetical protein